jgi:choline dehydrogenase-like flavoprotein
MTRRYDAVIVGSGAGGGIAAYVLAKGGMNVLVLEKGPWLTTEDYGDDELRFGDRNLIDQDPLVEPRTFRDRPEEGEHLFVGKVLGCSRGVGGGSVHYGAVSFRFRPEDFLARTTWGDLPDADIVDWPLNYAELRPFYHEVEKLIGVAGGDGVTGDPIAGAEWRAGDPDPYRKFPMPGHPPNYGAKLFEDAAARIGLHPFPTPVAINNGTYRGRPGCSYCGFCSSHGCPIEAKGDTRVTALAEALQTGKCTIRADANAVRVELANGRARRVVFKTDPSGVEHAVEAQRIILACSTVDTPRLVLLSELPRDLVNHDLVGRYLMTHHFPGGIGFFQKRIDYYRGFWSMRCLDDFYLGDPLTGQRLFGFGNVQTVGPSSGYPFFAGGMISTAKTVGWGRLHKTGMQNIFGHFQFIGMIGQDPPVRSNSVDLDPTVKDVYGLPAARITYSHHPNDYVVAALAVPHLEELLLAMGAVSTQGVFPFAATTSLPQLGKQDFHARLFGRQFPNTIGGLVNHQMGTMRMGANPDTSVVDEWQRFHLIPNLYVTDASVFPTSGGYNPTLTIQALAWRAAAHILEE